MKTPFSQNSRSTRAASAVMARPKFPPTDFCFHTAAMPKFGGGCTRAKLASFRNISGEYFRNEARGEFQRELIAFGAIIITAAIPLISNAQALAHFLRAFAAL